MNVINLEEGLVSLLVVICLNIIKFVLLLLILGAQCNQAIMIITEGLENNFHPELLKDFTMMDKFYRDVRIFTYQLETDPNDAKVLEQIACANMGK